ncbi:hypothetical protein QAD02_012950 [Eretmocerus hayati]|uniref:Uncharacterized protein n=1 Tax=Eretmocerus hayati TaxID=131215 RepID=A0ACC2P238_9HYME|nr:hypothetical protein QAD02_012950 [Eretmocerus hayati]
MSREARHPQPAGKVRLGKHVEGAESEAQGNVQHRYKPHKQTKYSRRRVASLGSNIKDILSYMQVKTSGKRKKQERSPENKAETIVEKKIIVKTNTEMKFAPEKDRNRDQEQTEDKQQKGMKDMEGLRKLMSSTHEDINNMEER